MERERFENKAGLGVVQETGITGDYSNEFSSFLVMRPEDFAEELRILPTEHGGKVLRHYQERFPAEKFADVVNDRNREQVAKIDALVDEVNTKAAAGTLIFNECRTYAEKLFELVYGKPYKK